MRSFLLAALLLIAWLCGHAAGADAPAAELPPAADHKIDFHKEILPLLTRRCAQCHAGGKREGGLAIESRASLLQGGDSGAAVVAGKSGDSLLVKLVAGRDPDRIMPAKGQRLTAEQIGLLRAWIDQGLAWDEGVTLAQAPPQAPLEPRRPELPAVVGGGSQHPIDRLLGVYFQRQDLAPGEVVSDRLFLRRVSLDLVGLIPTPAELDAFERDARPDKRALAVRRLLDDRQSYADHWLTFWNDALRNAYKGTGYIDGGRSQITGWLYKSLYDNKPYDQFVRELLSPVPGSEGFVKGIKWRGTVNASQRREMQAAQTVSQVLLGTNLKCASCHDSFVNHWKLTDAYALASVFADGPLEVHRCDKPSGAFVPPAFIYPQLGAINPQASVNDRLKQLAEIMVDPRNGRLSRTIVNRLWAWLFGRGLVEPIDDMDQEPWSRDLLDYLAVDLVDHKYDLKHTLELICTSRAYQLAAVAAPRLDEKSFVFRGPQVKRMTAEQFYDALSELTGVWQTQTSAMLTGDGRAQGGQLLAVRQAVGNVAAAPTPPAIKAIWSHAQAASSDPGGRILVRKQFEITDLPTRAPAAATCDNEMNLFVNGRRAGGSKDWQQGTQLDIKPFLVKGTNTIAIEAINWPDPETGKGLEFKGANPAGLAFAAVGYDDDKQLWTVVTDASWTWAKSLPDGWQQPQFDASAWQPVAELPGNSGLVGVVGNKLSVLSQYAGKLRAVMADADPLATALGRPHREQVVTRRESLATTLQALELTNGATLDAWLRRGAKQWRERTWPSNETLPTEMVKQLYRTALGRDPAAEESAAAIELLGSPVTEDGVVDLLWALAMLPEFQLIH